MEQYGAGDFKNSNGLWARSFRSKSNASNVQVHTRAGFIWADIVKRTTAGGRSQSVQPTYAGCTNGFSDFQEFASWAVVQPGYLDFDSNGNRYQIDKDILYPGNKIYSRETCVFVPQKINGLFNIGRSGGGALPVGVSIDPSTRKYRSRIKVMGRTISLGSFSSLSDAHIAWQGCKADQINNAVVEYSAMPGFRTDVACAIMRRAWEILVSRSYCIPTTRI